MESRPFKVLLVFPYTTQRRNHRWHPVEPLGLLSLATFARDRLSDRIPLEIRILDCLFEGPAQCTPTDIGFRVGMTDAQIEEAVRSFAPDIVGVANSYTNTTGDVLDLVDTIRKAWPSCFLVVGGAHATIDHENMAANPNVDAVVRGEGEETFNEIIERRHGGGGMDGVAGVTYRADGQVKVNPDRPLIPDIDVLPIPDRSFLRYRDYLAETGRHYSRPKQLPVGTVFSARGCAFRCIFCSTQKVWRNCWRPRSPQKMFEEVEHLHRVYGVREVAFQDDQFMGDRDRIKEFCRKVIASGLPLTFLVPPGLSPALLDRETLVLMARAGFYRICLSIDVGSQKAVHFSRKPVKLAKMRSIVQMANRTGLWTYATFVIGYPYETIEDVQATIRFAYGLKLDLCIFYIAQPHLGSELYDQYLREGKITPHQVSRHHLPDESLFGTDNLSAEELESLRTGAQTRYPFRHLLHFLNPVYFVTEFLPKIATPGRFRYFLTVLGSWMEFAGLTGAARPMRRKRKAKETAGA